MGKSTPIGTCPCSAIRQEDQAETCKLAITHTFCQQLQLAVIVCPPHRRVKIQNPITMCEKKQMIHGMLQMPKVWPRSKSRKTKKETANLLKIRKMLVNMRSSPSILTLVEAKRAGLLNYPTTMRPRQGRRKKLPKSTLVQIAKGKGRNKQELAEAVQVR